MIDTGAELQRALTDAHEVSWSNLKATALCPWCGIDFILEDNERFPNNIRVFKDHE